MLIKAIDDLHFEFHKDRGKAFARDLPTGGYLDTDMNRINPVGPARVLVLAGDITTVKAGYVALEILADRFQDVVYVFGNHDHYHTSNAELLWEVNEFKELNHITNLHVLQHSSVTIEDKDFHGTTLWFQKEIDSWRLSHYLNDFAYIKDGGEWIYNQHIEACQFLDKAIKPGDIVVTHHLPSYQLISPVYAGDDMNIFYANKLDYYVEKREAAYWFHGHSHESCNMTIGKTKCVRNPYGYHDDIIKNAINPNWNPEAMFEV